RQSKTDGLGRLVEVDELQMGSTVIYSATLYGYDARGNLRTVTQGPQGTQQSRQFTYDGLSRLTQATNPESGTINYSLYDANGNLLTKTDNRLITTTYTYDALNRIKDRSYSDSTPEVTYAYDTSPGGVGRLASVSSAVSRESYDSYDLLGRVLQSSQTT